MYERAFARKPFFVPPTQYHNLMELRTQIEELLERFLQERTDLFLLDLKVSATNDVTVILDGDQGVSLQDCLDASRAVEFSLDRDEQDFSLQVMSAGLSEPLTLPRQYIKNIGRTLKVTKTDGTETEAELVKADEVGITLLLKFRKPKEIGKGKVDAEEEIEIPYADIKRALVTVKF